MTNKKVSQLPELGTVNASDLLYVVDVSDTTDGAEGSSKKTTVNALGYASSKSTSSINLKSYGAKGDGVTDDSAAILAAWTDLTNDNSIGELIVPDGVYMTREFGAASSDAAWVSAGLGTLSGKTVRGIGIAQFKLIAGENSALITQNMATSNFVNLRFHGNNPMPGWGGALNNPSTVNLVDLYGYGFDLENCVAEFSGGNGFRLRGFVGVVDIRGSRSKAWFNWGYGYVIERCAAVRFTSPWVEQNAKGGIYVWSSDVTTPTLKSYYLNSGINITNLYYERVSDYTGTGLTKSDVITIHGQCGVTLGDGYYAQKQGADVDLVMTANTNSDAGYQGANSNIIYVPNAAFVAEIGAGCDDNRLIRTSQFKRTSRFLQLTDAGENNKAFWQGLPRAFTPSENATSKTIYGVNSNFAYATTINDGSVVEGGALDPISDYDSVNARSSYVSLDGIAGTSNASLYNNHVLPTSVVLYAVLALEAPAQNNMSLQIQDAISGDYYDWYNKGWNTGASDAITDFLFETEADRLWYVLPFTMDAVATRQVRLNVKSQYSPSSTKLYHGYICDDPSPPIASIRSSVVQRLGNFLNLTTALLPTATAVPVGTTVFDTTAGALKTSDGTNWV